MGAPKANHPEDTVAFIRESAGTLPDHAIGAALGFSAHKVYTIRKAHGIPSGYRKRRPQAVIDHVRAEYVEKGRPANDVGADLGVTGTSVRRIAQENGMKRPREFMRRNAGEGVRRLLKAHPRPKKIPEPRSKLEKPDVTINDAALIAEFLASKSVTVLAPGQACGIGAWEMALGKTAWPPNTSLRDAQARGRANAAHRRRLELAKSEDAAA